MHKCFWSVFGANFLIVSSMAFSQAGDEPLFDQLTKSLKKEAFSVGAVFQTVADFQTERSFSGQNGFSIANMRLSASGNLDKGFGYFFQTNFANTPTVLDAKMRFALSGSVELSAGLFKAPFSDEFLISAASIDFVNRSQVVTALVPGRQIGFQIQGNASGGEWVYVAGLFNGNSFANNTNDNKHFLYVARVEFHPSSFQNKNTADHLEIGVNLGRSEDQSANLSGGFIRGFQGTRTLVGADVRLTQNQWLFSGEVIAARFKFSETFESEPVGYHATVGYMTTPKSQLLLRWDSFSPDGIQPDLDTIVIGYNFWPSQPTELQANLIIPVNGNNQNPQLLINAQVAF